MAFLDKTGTLFLVTKFNGMLGNKVDKETGKGLSANDFTDDLKNKLEGIAAGAGNYQHPAYNPAVSGLYKITVDGTGHVSAVTAVTKADIVALGIPGQDTNTTYGEATEESGGLMSAADKAKLDGIEEGANKYGHPAHTAYASGIYKITVDASGHVVGAAAVTKADITALGIPGTDTTYAEATPSTSGLMSAGDKAKLDAFGAAADYAKKSDITAVYRYCGSVDSAADLPAAGKNVGDTYDIVEASGYGPAGTNVSWTGSGWDALGGTFTVEAITTAEIEAMFTA